MTPPEAISELVAEARLVQRRWASRTRIGARCSAASPVSCSTRPTRLAATVTAETGKPLLESYTAELFLALEQLRWTAANAEQVIGAERVRLHAAVPAPQARPAPVRALRRRRGDHAVELPVRDPVHTDHCGRGGRQLGRDQAVRARAAHGVGGTRVPRRRARRRGSFELSQGCRHRRAARPRAWDREGLLREVHRGRCEGRGRRRRASVPGLARARRQGRCWCSRTPISTERSRARSGGSFSNCGQTCASVERIYVARDLYQSFVEELGRRAGRLRIGPGSDFQTELGPLISEKHRAKVERLVGDAVDGGAVAATVARGWTLGFPAGSTSRPS